MTRWFLDPRVSWGWLGVTMNDNTPQAPSMERRSDKNKTSMWGELVVEPSWRPTDKPKVEPGWLHANGYLPERREH
jgi:hypothetical protein